MARMALVAGGLLLVVLLVALLLGIPYVRDGVPVAQGYAAKMVCSFVFVGGQDADDIYARYVAPAIAPAGPMLSISVDQERRRVTASYPGFDDRTAVYREGLGCTLAVDRKPEWLTATRPDDPRLGAVVERAPRPGRPWPEGRNPPEVPPPPGLVAAFDEAFAEPGGALRQTTAVAIAHRGNLVAERYAPGFGPRTRMLSWSMAKSVSATLIGIAASQGLLDLDERAPVEAWGGSDDPRLGITWDQLLRMSSGLEFGEVYSPPSDATRMLYLEHDMGAFAASRPPAAPRDTVWSYSSGTTNLLMRLLRDRVGGLGRTWHFAFTYLFGAIGMTSAIMEPDESGSFVGSSYMWATTRDWLRFGELYRRDGYWGRQRILPAGWVEYSVTPTPRSEGAYGGHWWLNIGRTAEQRQWPTLPPETYAARGHSGQYLLVIPTHDLVVVRLGLSHDGADHGVEPLASAAIDWAASQ